MKHRYIYYILVLMIIILLTAIFKNNFGWDGKGDYRIASIDNDQLKMVSISPERKMINYLIVPSDSQIWIPGGLGWYEGKNIKNILNKEKKQYLIKEIFFYNFGFWPDKIYWNDLKLNWRSLGLFGWIKYVFFENEMMVKEEKLNGDYIKNQILIDEVAVRDFADSKLLSMNIRLSLYNTTNVSGVANFLSQRMEWAGFSVMGVSNDEKKIDKCLIIGENNRLREIFHDCQFEKGENNGEIEMYFGDKFLEMIKYSSYVRTQ